MNKKLYWIKVEFNKPINTLTARPEWVYSGVIYDGDDASHLITKNNDTERLYIYTTKKACDKAAARWWDAATDRAKKVNL